MEPADVTTRGCSDDRDVVVPRLGAGAGSRRRAGRETIRRPSPHTLRQRADIQRGRHPLTGSRLNPDPDATCGNCRFRIVYGHHNRSYPKCTYGDGMPRASHSAASDVRAWWPACRDHEYGDTRLSPDAARCKP